MSSSSSDSESIPTSLLESSLWREASGQPSYLSRSMLARPLMQMSQNPLPEADIVFYSFAGDQEHQELDGAALEELPIPMTPMYGGSDGEEEVPDEQPDPRVSFESLPPECVFGFAGTASVAKLGHNTILETAFGRHLRVCVLGRFAVALCWHGKQFSLHHPLFSLLQTEQQVSFGTGRGLIVQFSPDGPLAYGCLAERGRAECFSLTENGPVSTPGTISELLNFVPVPGQDPTAHLFHEQAAPELNHVPENQSPYSHALFQSHLAEMRERDGQVVVLMDSVKVKQTLDCSNTRVYAHRNYMSFSPVAGSISVYTPWIQAHVDAGGAVRIGYGESTVELNREGATVACLGKRFQFRLRPIESCRLSVFPSI